VPPGIDIKNERYWALTGAYNAQVEEYKNQVKDLSEQVTGFASDNREFREKITQYDKDNAEMKNSVASTVARVDALAERVDNADASISDLQAGQSQAVTDIAALEAKDADLQRQISSNDTDISALQAKDREQDARLSAIETVNDAQAATLSQNTQDIARNTENIQDNAANIAVNSKELAKHAAQLKDHTAQLSVLHTEVTDNHTAIERLTSATEGLRADLTEDEAKIAQNADAIAHIQQKDVQQDGRLDALEGRATTAEGRLDALDDKTDATNTALTAETNRAKAAELANGELIAANAQELARHSDELSDHERRISSLETDNTTNKQDIADIKAKNAAQDTAIAAVDDKVEHLELIDPQEYAATIQRIDAKDAAQDTAIASLQTDKANKTDIPSLDDYATKVYVDNGLSAKVNTTTYTTEQAAQDELINKKVDQWADSYQRTKCVAMFAAVNKQADGTMELFGVFPAGNGLRKNPNTSPFSLGYGEGGTVRIFKPDGTEVDKTNIKASYNNWGQAYNMMPTLRVTLKPAFTPDSPFYILLYQNDASKPDNL
jgi:chromosome segregation ATPase